MQSSLPLSPSNSLFLAERPSIAVISCDYGDFFNSWRRDRQSEAAFFCGDAINVLSELPSDSIDCVMTSPPYWGKRDYASGGIGQEDDPQDYVAALAGVGKALHRVLKPSGSFWLNLGDSFRNKGLLGLPWRVALALTDSGDWILRNSVIWNKVKGGMDNSPDRLSNVHEHVFHFVKSRKYYYDMDAIRNDSRKSKVVNGSVVSATGVSGVRYRRQVELSTALTASEKTEALIALDKMLGSISSGELSDFRMVLRKQQRATHSDNARVSGRARELQEKGFYFLKYNPKGSKPSDVWDILPEDTQNRKLHFAAYSVELCYIPIRATCPPNGIVLDPFCGTGTTQVAAMELGRKSLGIDLANEYLIEAAKRVEKYR